MTNPHDPESSTETTPDDAIPVDPVKPSDWVKPVELIELLHRRAAKRRKPAAPTASPFYDAEFVANHPTRRRKSGQSSSSSSSS
ncbi:hypothetical protein CQY20_08675 [Mycolicibacterium agri]|uniref:Uncharacterized protein n=1 Tax=Mycolicibacterium agri TaxID=36811 RepID=A0A2A7N8B3_MYCAG|nr:hypothetical protein [Mycolicibacterium agri]PEG39957.1 hypothetical protein CQY20_08675 [Mycolicibacterium agri]GFG51459.1 hypothetical protein MAGR_29000 [Mycolicibacterium agri]